MVILTFQSTTLLCALRFLHCWKDINRVFLCVSVLWNSYIGVYGLRFSKEDHIALVKLFFELVTIDNLESPLLDTWCQMLTKLLK